MENTVRRDQLLAIQQAAQAKWERLHVFEADAPPAGEQCPEGRFFGNFPYPYMNGVLHLGHAFSISKLEIVSAFHRLCGKRVLFPQGFHCTGMPIKACADRLRGEVEQFGCPPDFPEDGEADRAPPTPVAPAGTGGAERASTVVPRAGKSKVAAKKGKGATQWEILRNSGIPESEIHLFQDPKHWLLHFPPIAKADLSALGCGIDWRRTFITTDSNPFYDAFVRWQLLTLRAAGKVVKDKRYAVYSRKDGQPCADHDRASGEGVNPQEYTLIKMTALELPGKLTALSGYGAVHLMAATLRPETMYGQTNCWVLPEGDYGAFEAPGNEVYIMCERAAMNLAFQDKLPHANASPHRILALKGSDLIGLPLHAPRCPLPCIRVLPLLTILMTKGTGVVTSVPSDSPTDFVALRDLQRKERLREKFGVADDWVLGLEPIPIIDIPGFGNLAAVKVVEDLKIQSQNDEKKLEEAKGLVYLRGFTDGVMVAGAHAGEPVSTAKPRIRAALLEGGEAIVYAEPESRVVSRSGDECIVALTDQWYITYGEPDWRAKTEGALARMELFDETVRNGFSHTLGWLNQWACSRSFGLGTLLPWDEEYLIESLSDSTIYMAYYTVAHILQGGDMFGEGAAAAGEGVAVRPEQMTPGVWDAIFLDRPIPEGCEIDPKIIQKMRAEFQFWYPFDLRVSGKDLIQNHLTFCLYTHTAIWPEDKWPRAFRTNGHLMLNAEKMSKSTGNFLTLRQAIDRYSSDAVRFALADASDSNDDGNFEESTANAAILNLTKELVWIEESLAADAAGGLRGGPPGHADRVLANAASCAAAASRAAYERVALRAALHAGWVDLRNARDAYRVQLGPAGMHGGTVRMFIDTLVRVTAPVCPHWADHIFCNVLKAGETVVKAGWPELPAPDMGLKRAGEYVDKLVTRLRGAVEKKETPPKKKKGQVANAVSPPKVTSIDLFISHAFTGWRAAVLDAMRASCGGSEARGGAGSALQEGWQDAALEAASSHAELAGLQPKLIKATVLPFVKFKAAEAEEGGKQALELSPPFDEMAVLMDYLPHLERALGLPLRLHSADEDDAEDKDGPLPLEPRAALQTAAREA